MTKEIKLQNKIDKLLNKHQSDLSSLKTELSKLYVSNRKAFTSKNHELLQLVSDMYYSFKDFNHA